MKKHNVNGSCNGHGCRIIVLPVDKEIEEIKNNYDIENSCGTKRGCSVIFTLPYGGISWTILSRVYEIRNDIQKILPLVGISLDEKLAQERQMEKVAA